MPAPITTDLAVALAAYNVLVTATFSTPPASLRTVCSALQPALANVMRLAAPLQVSDSARLWLLLNAQSQFLAYLNRNFPDS
jgi:hypothetical protein